MAKAKFNKDQIKLIEQYDLSNKSHRDIDKIAKGNVDLGLTLHKLKSEMTSSVTVMPTKQEQIKQRVQKKKEAVESAKATVEKAKQEGRSLKVKVQTKKSKPKKSSASTKKTSGSTHKKDPGAKKTSAERKQQTEKLRQYREQLEVLVEEANQRVDRLSKLKKTSSRALDEAIRTLPTSRSTDELFTSDLRTEKQITRELSRVMEFLGDYTSLARGAENFTDDLTAAGLFGGQYRANGGPGYNTDEVDEEVGEKVFDIYHRVLEVEGGWSRVMGYFKANSGGLVEYGSENLINAIYDMVVNFGTSDKATEKIINRATSMIDDMVDAYQAMAIKQRSGVDYGFLGNDENSQDRLNRWNWEMERRGIKL